MYGNKNSKKKGGVKGHVWFQTPKTIRFENKQEAVHEVEALNTVEPNRCKIPRYSPLDPRLRCEKIWEPNEWTKLSMYEHILRRTTGGMTD
jgi:hypothetical protein